MSLFTKGAAVHFTGSLTQTLTKRCTVRWVQHDTNTWYDITIQYNALHRNMTQHILLKPVIPSPHPIFRNDPFPPPKYRNKLWQSSGYTKQKIKHVM